MARQEWAPIRQTLGMSHRYTLEQAQALLPDARRRIADAAETLANLRRLMQGLRQGGAPGATPDEAATLERRLEDQLRWFDEQGIQVKGIAPALLDFPANAVRDGEPLEVLLCWRDDEDAIAFYHPPETGYAGREPVAMLDQV
jgi:hypothetical protein